MESGSHVDCLGLVWILGMFNLALELLLDYRSTMMIWVFWSPSFPQISSRFICWSCGWWRRTDLFWTLRSGFHPIRFQVLRHDGGFSIISFYSPPSHLPFIICVIWHIKKAFWILGHHTETFLIALPASPAHWDCWEMMDFYRGPVPWFVWLQRGIDRSTWFIPYLSTW